MTVHIKNNATTKRSVAALASRKRLAQNDKCTDFLQRMTLLRAIEIREWSNKNRVKVVLIATQW